MSQPPRILPRKTPGGFPCLRSQTQPLSKALDIPGGSKAAFAALFWEVILIPLIPTTFRNSLEGRMVCALILPGRYKKKLGPSNIRPIVREKIEREFGPCRVPASGAGYTQGGEDVPANTY